MVFQIQEGRLRNWRVFKNWQRHLIAMTTHGRSGVKHWVLGSVTEKIVRHSGDPVLVMPAKFPHRAEERVPISEAHEEFNIGSDTR
jgi:Universal stress protein family